MSLETVATIVVSTTGAGVTRAGYGVVAILSPEADWVERYRVYASLTAVAEDFDENSATYLAAEAVFSQSPKLPRLIVLRQANKPTQRFALGVQGVGLNTDYNVRVAIATGVVWKSQDAEYNTEEGPGPSSWSPSNTWTAGDAISYGGNFYSCLGKSGPSGFLFGYGFSGIGAGSGPSGVGAAIQEGEVFWMFASSGSSGTTNDLIINAVKSQIDMLDSPPVVGTGTGQLTSSLQGSAGSRTLRLLANTAGKFFGVEISSREALNIEQDHDDPGVAADLTAGKNASNAWYGLVTLFNSQALVLAAAAWVEANTKLYGAASLDSKCATDSVAIGTDNIKQAIKDAAYARSWVFFHPANDEFADAAEFGKFFTYDPGSETWRMKTLAGVTVQTYSETEADNLTDGYAHFYADMGGVNVVHGDAKTGSGEYVDTIRGLDWYTSELQAKLANLAIGLPKIPYTNPGIDGIEAKVEAQNAEGIRRGFIAADPAPVVITPDAADVSTEDKLARELEGVETEFTLAGAVHHITVRVTANP